MSDLDLTACAESTVCDDDVGAILDCLQRRWFTGTNPTILFLIRCGVGLLAVSARRSSIRFQSSAAFWQRQWTCHPTTVADWKWVVITSLPDLRSRQTEPFSSAGLQHRADVQPSSDRVRRRLAVILGRQQSSDDSSSNSNGFKFAKPDSLMNEGGVQRLARSRCRRLGPADYPC